MGSCRYYTSCLNMHFGNLTIMVFKAILYNYAFSVQPTGFDGGFEAINENNQLKKKIKISK